MAASRRFLLVVLVSGFDDIILSLHNVKKQCPHAMAKINFYAN